MKKALRVAALTLALAFMLTVVAFAADTAADVTVIEYDCMSELIAQGNPTYIQALKNIEIEEDRLKDLYLQLGNVRIASESDWSNAINLSSKVTAQEKTIRSQKEALEKTLAQQLWQAQELFLTNTVLLSKLDQQIKTLELLKSQREVTAKKYELGMLSKASLKSADTQITEQEKNVSQAQDDIDDNLDSLKTILGVTETITPGDLPDLDVSVIPERDYESDLETYLKYLPSLVSQREKLDSITDTYDYKSAYLQLKKLETDAIAGFPAQFEALQSKYVSWKELEDNINDKREELADLQKQYELGNTARKKVTDKQSEIDTLLLNQETGKIELYQAMRRYENTLIGQ